MTTQDQDALQDLFPGDSEMSRLMRAHDWASTPLGPPQAWPAGLKVPVRMMLTSKFEMWLGWGEDLAFFCNHAYLPTLGVKHPDALGRPVRDGQATRDKALLLLLERSGYPEETYHTFSYSPLMGDDGRVGGLMCVVSEETERVVSDLRLFDATDVPAPTYATTNPRYGCRSSMCLRRPATR